MITEEQYKEEYQKQKEKALRKYRMSIWSAEIGNYSIISDSEANYYLVEVDISHSVQHNRPTVSQLAYNSKYPFHIHNGQPNYYSGSCTCSFNEKIDDEDDDYDIPDNPCEELQQLESVDDPSELEFEFDFSDNPIYEETGNYIYNTAYVDGFVQWLHDDTVKTLQLTKNMSIPVGILGEIQWDRDYSIENGETVRITFNWEQLDDATISSPTT